MSQNIIVANVVLPRNKKVFIGLQAVYGIGDYIAKNICKVCNIDSQKKTSDLTEEEIVKIRAEVEKILVGDDLRSKNALDISRLKAIGCRRALRLQKGLPSRGQRSKTNGKTAKKMKGLFSGGVSASESTGFAKGNKGGKNTKGGKSNTKNQAKKKK